VSEDEGRLATDGDAAGEKAMTDAGVVAVDEGEDARVTLAPFAALAAAFAAAFAAALSAFLAAFAAAFASFFFANFAARFSSLVMGGGGGGGAVDVEEEGTSALVAAAASMASRRAFSFANFACFFALSFLFSSSRDNAFDWDLVRAVLDG